MSPSAITAKAMESLSKRGIAMTPQEYWSSEGIRFLNPDGTIPDTEQRVKGAFARGFEEGCSVATGNTKKFPIWATLLIIAAPWASLYLVIHIAGCHASALR